MSGGGKSSTSTSSVSIPPEVLARYNAVNERADVIAQQPFQPYTGEFVAPLTQTQQAGIANINQAAGMAQPYYQAAGSAITGGAAQAQPYYQAATNQVYGGLAAAQPLQQASIANQLAGQAAGTQALQDAFGASQPVMQGALTGLSNIPVQSLPFQQQAMLGISQAQAAADPYQQAAYGSLMQAGAQAQPFTANAQQSLAGGVSAAQPVQQQAVQGVSAAQAAGAPYQQLATQFGLAGAQRIDPNALNVQRYMSPYMEAVAQPTLKALQQQQQQEQQKILGDQIRGGAFGGDRGKIAQAVLAQQQGMATSQTLGNIYQQGYGQALSTAQQQQQTALAADQANRAAQQAAAQQMLGIGQQGFGQQMSAAQMNAALGQQFFGQGLAGSQQQAALGQQVFGQGATTAQQQAALAQQLYAQGMGGVQAQQGLAQQLINQGLGIAGQQAGIGQNLFGQGAQAAQQLYGMGAGTAQQQAALAQQQYAQQMGASQQLQGLGQGLYGIGAGVGQGLTGLGGAAQQAALQGGQAQLGAGTVQQQTQQALNQANYNQFLQQQGYPFQVGQYLGNLAMGTGALSGSTTTTTQPSSFFSDERLKDDVEPIGKTYDGQDIVRYRYKGEPATRIGLIAQDVEKKHPEAVGLAGGFKTVDYDRATDEAAERAPHKAYGGGLSPWHGGSMGGSVFREDAGAGFAAGGAPGDDILAQINALVNSHQGMFPYGKAGMYGSGMGKAGPYGSTLMQAPSRGLMRAENVGPRQTSAMEDIESTMRRVEAVEKGFQKGKGAVQEIDKQLSFSPEYRGQGPTQSGAPLGTGERSTLRDYWDSWFGGGTSTSSVAPGSARGGAIRPGLAMGGMPYSNAMDEYVPEDLSEPVKPQTLQPSKPPTKDQSGEDFQTALKIAGIAAAFMGSDRRLKENIKAVGKTNDGQTIYRYNYKGDPRTQIGLIAQEVEKRHPDAVGLSGGYKTVDYEKATDGAVKRSAGGMEALKEKGLAPRKKYERGGGDVPEDWRSHLDEASRSSGVPAHILSAVLRQESDFGRSAPNNPFQIIESTARDPGYGVSPIALEDRARPEIAAPWAARYIAARNPDVDWSNPPAAARALHTNWNGGGDPNYGYNVGRYISGMSPEDLVALRVSNNQEPGLAPPASSSAGSAPSSNRPFAQADYASRENVQSPYMRQALQVLQDASKREEPDWMQRNQDWLVPLLTGLGTMASSPSRYLGSSILQGIAGGAQTYAGMQKTLEEQRVAREGRAQAGIQRLTEAGRLDVDRLREMNAQQQLGLRALQEFIGQYRVTREGGQTVYVGPGGNILTQEQFQQEKNRIMRQFNLSSEQASSMMPAAPSGASQTAPSTTPGTQRPTAPSAAQPPSAAPDRQGLTTPAQQDAVPEPARQNQEFVNQQAAQITRLIQDSDAATRRVAELQGDPATRFSNEITTLQGQINQWNAERNRLENQPHTAEGQVQYVIRPGTQSDYSPPPANRERASVNPTTGAVSTAPVRLGFASNGGFPVPQNLPPRDVQIIRHPAVEAARPINAAASRDFLSATEGIDENIATTARLATALKVIEANGLNTNFTELGQMLNGLGFTALGDSLMRPQSRDAALTAAKDGIMGAIQLGGRSFPRMTQNEFQTLSTRAMPNVDMTPNSVVQLLRSNLAESLKAAALRRDWTEAQNNGVENFQGFFEQWRQQNPTGMWFDSADRLIGNLRGQSLPSTDKLTEGVVYVMPRRMNENEAAISRQFNIRPGSMFVVSNVDRNEGRVSFDAQALPTGVDAFSVYRRAPGFGMYGGR